jgi:predicted dehydrogenase
MPTNLPPPLRLAGIGCGSRTRTYLRLASEFPHLYAIVGGADPVPERVDRVHESCGRPPHFRRFTGWRSLLAEDRFADVVVIGTQDADHREPCLAALEKGYDILLEKPVATRLEDVLEIEQRARRLNRRVLVCHVLRYTPFYRRIKKILESGVLGEIVSLNATEGVNPWHQAHSFVRGHWAVAEKASPMIIAKSCHDLDILSWLLERPCTDIHSYGGLAHFTAANAPQGAPARCTDGCPAGSSCAYNALLYASAHRSWLAQVMDGHERRHPPLARAKPLGPLRVPLRQHRRGPPGRGHALFRRHHGHLHHDRLRERAQPGNLRHPGRAAGG